MSWLRKKLESGKPFSCKDIYKKLGFKFVMGIAINGDTAIAGPMSVASVILPYNHDIKNLVPHKELSSEACMEVYKDIREQCVSLNFGWASPSIMFNAGKEKALNSAFGIATGGVNMYNPVSVIIVDGYDFSLHFDNLESEGMPVISSRGVSSMLDTVIAADISAKVAREQVMLQFYHKRYNEYSWDTNFGYATKKHIESIKKHGITPFHRDLSGVKSIQDAVLFANIKERK